MVQYVTDTFRALGDETRALTVDGVTKKQRGVSDREKNFIFNYLREGDIPPAMRIVANDPAQNLHFKEPESTYKTNVFVIVESFFTYGFIPELLEA